MNAPATAIAPRPTRARRPPSLRACLGLVALLAVPVTLLFAPAGADPATPGSGPGLPGPAGLFLGAGGDDDDPLPIDPTPTPEPPDPDLPDDPPDPIEAVRERLEPALEPLKPITDLLAYEIRTVYSPPGEDPIVRTTDGLLFAPIPVNVDGDVETGLAGQDILVQLQIDAGRATVRVVTLPGAPDPLPLKVEAILADPRGGSPFRVAFGYDARDATAPEVYDAAVMFLGEPTRRVTSFSVEMQTVGAGSTLGVIAEIFTEGPDGERIDPVRGRVDYTPVPTATHFGILLGEDLGTQQTSVDLVSDRFTLAEVRIADITSERQIRADIVFDRLPHALTLVLTDAPGGQRHWNYQASARVDLIELRVSETRGGSLVDEFVLRLDDMATNASIVQTSPTRATFEASSPIGAVTVGNASGGAIRWLEDPAYIYADNRGGVDSFAFRVLGLRRAIFETGDPFMVDVTLQAGPFRVLFWEGDQRTEAWIVDLPSQVRVEFSPTQERLSIQGSAPIDLISVDVVNPAGISGRATDLGLRLEEVPQEMEVTWQADGVVSLSASDAGIRFVSLDLTSGPILELDPGFDGLLLEDVDEHYALAVRLHGLRLISVTTGEPPTVFTIRKDPGPFMIRLVEGGGETDIRILDLPAELEAVFDPAGSMSVTASDRIGSITAMIRDPEGAFAGRATALDLLLDDVPTSFVTSWETNGVVGIDAGDDRIGLVDLLLTSGPAIEIDPGFDGILLEDVVEHYVVRATLNGLRTAQATSGEPPTVLTLRKDPGPFMVRLVEGERVTDFRILDLPAELQAEFDPDGRLTLTASDPVDQITATIHDPAGVADRATDLALLIEDLPTTLDLSWEAGGIVGIDAGDGRIGLFDLLLTSGPALEVDPGFDGVVLEDLASHYAAAVRLRGLQTLQVSTGEPPTTFLMRKDSGPFVVRITEGDRFTEITILDVPDQLQAVLDPTGGFSYEGSAPVGEIRAEVLDPAGIAGDAVRATVLLQDIPQTLEVSWSPDAGGIVADAGGATLGLLEVLATSGPDYSLPADRDGVTIHELADESIAFLRITGLRRVEVEQGPPPALTLETTGGRRFVAEVRQQKPGGIAVTEADIQVLPATLEVQFTGPTTFAYRASAPVSSLTMYAFDPEGISGRADTLTAAFTSLPVSLDLEWTDEGRVVLDAGGGTVGGMEIQLTSGPDERIPAGRDGILLNDLADRYVVFMRMTGLQRIDAIQQPLPDILIQSTGNRIMQIELNTQVPGKVEYNRAILDRLPSSVRIRFVEQPWGQEVFYDASAATNGLTFESNSGDRWVLEVSLTNPLPASFYLCQAENNACGGSGRTANAGSVRLLTSEHTTLNFFDCQRPLNTNCNRSNATHNADMTFSRVDNLRVRRVVMDAHASGSGESGHIFLDTGGHTMSGSLLNRDAGGGGFRATFGSGFWSNNRLGTWSLWGLVQNKSGSINCAGTSLEVRVLGLWIGVTGFLC